MRNKQQQRSQSSSGFYPKDDYLGPSNSPKSYFRQRKQKIKLTGKRSNVSTLKNYGSWTSSEELNFLTFMEENRSIFENKPQRRKLHIFKEMSIYIGTRSAEQCRSHHQKYQIRLRDFDNIAQVLRKKISAAEFTEKKLPNQDDKAICFGPINFHKKKQAQDWYSLRRMPQNNLNMALNDAKGVLSQIRTASFKVFQPIRQGEGYQVLELKGSHNEISILIDPDIFFQ